MLVLIIHCQSKEISHIPKRERPWKIWNLKLRLAWQLRMFSFSFFVVCGLNTRHKFWLTFWSTKRPEHVTSMLEDPWEGLKGRTFLLQGYRAMKCIALQPLSFNLMSSLKKWHQHWYCKREKVKSQRTWNRTE